MIKKYYFPIILAVLLAAAPVSAEEKQSAASCQKDSDCVLIAYDCNQAVTFNKAQAAEQRDKLCAAEDCSLRDCEEFRHFNHLAQCVKNECTVKATAKDDLDPGGKKWVKRFVKINRPNFSKKNEKIPVSLGLGHNSYK